MEIVKIVFAAILTAVLYNLIKQIKPELAPLVILAGIAIIIGAVLEKFLEISGATDEMMELAGIDKSSVSILMRSVGICVVTHFASDICRDNSCLSIASAVELAGSIGAIALAMPMIKAVALLAMGFIQ